MDTNHEECRFSVYRHVSHLDGRPFYVGRSYQNFEGKSPTTYYPRAYSAVGRSTDWQEIAEHGYDVEILFDDLPLEVANQKEVEFIALHGKRINGGILVNCKDGGEDCMTDYKHSPETIAKFSEKLRKPLEQSMEEYIAYEPNTGCWIWTGTFIEGHPKVNVDNRTLNAVRTIYQHVNNVKLRPKVEVLHNSCGCDHCVNPQHYYIGQSCPPEKQHRILTDEQVLQIVHLLKTTSLTQVEIAREVGASIGMVEGIAIGRTFKHITGGGKIKRPCEPANKKKKVRCVNTGEVFEGSKEASSHLFGSSKRARDIRAVCAGTRGVCLGFRFEYV